MKYLTIAIPTYNGELTISDSLLSILKSLDLCVHDEVEVIICDNASTDNTFNIVNEIIINNKKYDIKYYANSTNKGADCNFDLAVKRAKGKYVWLFSDSERIVNEKSIIDIVKLLKKRYYDFLMLNYENPLDLRNIPNLYDNGNDFFLNTKFKSNLITSCIVNREEWMSYKLERYYGSCWIQIAYQVHALSPKRKCCVMFIKDIFFRQMEVDHKWGQNGSFLFIGINLIKICSEMVDLGYDRLTTIECCKEIKNSYPRNICLARINGLKINKIEYDEIRCLYERVGSPLNLIDKFFFKCPTIFCHFCYRLYKVFKFIRNFLYNTHIVWLLW